MLNVSNFAFIVFVGMQIFTIQQNFNDISS